MHLSVIIPMYNVAAFVEPRFQALSQALQGMGQPYEVIAVDDGSTDGSADGVRALDLPSFSVLPRARNGGKFAAIRDGVLKSRGGCVLFTDADVPFDLRALPYMTELVLQRGFQLVLGDRTCAESRYREGIERPRAWATSCFRLFIRLFVTGGVYDTQCGIKAMQGEVARRLLPLIREHGFAGDVELIYVALKYNLAMRRVPVRLVYQGPSSVRVTLDGIAMLRASLRLRSRYRHGAYEDAQLRDLVSQNYFEDSRPEAATARHRESPAR